jgi:hypothetical protein
MSSQMMPFENGERLRYSIDYNLGLIRMPAGEMVSTLSVSNHQSTPVYLFDIKGYSLNSYDWIYKFTSHMQAQVDKNTLKPLWSKVEMNKNGKESKDYYTFDHTQPHTIYISNTNTSRKKDTVIYNKTFFDYTSAAYYLRSINYANLKVGEKQTFQVICDNKLYPISFCYLGKQQIITHNKVKYHCLKLSVSLIEGDIFNKGDQMLAWVTDDAKHIPVQFEANILVGSVKMYLTSVENISPKMVCKN